MEITQAFRDSVRGERMRNRLRDPRSGTYGRSGGYLPSALARHVRDNETIMLVSALGLGLLAATALGGWAYSRNRRRRPSRKVLRKLRLEHFSFR